MQKPSFDMSAEEEKQLNEAMKQPEFRRLLDDYMKEISDPAARAEQEKYIEMLEQQVCPEYGKERN
jgi:dynein assembly factor 2